MLPKYDAKSTVAFSSLASLGARRGVKGVHVMGCNFKADPSNGATKWYMTRQSSLTTLGQNILFKYNNNNTSQCDFTHARSEEVQM